MEHVIELFVADHCPGCPDARRRVREFADTHPNVTLIERNVDEALHAAETYGLIATPAIVVDGRSVLSDRSQSALRACARRRSPEP